MQRLLKIRVLSWFTILLEMAIANLLRYRTRQRDYLGILRSPKTTRNEIRDYLKSNPSDSNGFPLLEHLADDEFACCDDYITHMARDGTYGDQITLYVVANLYN